MRALTSLTADTHGEANATVVRGGLVPACWRGVSARRRPDSLALILAFVALASCGTTPNEPVVPARVPPFALGEFELTHQELRAVPVSLVREPLIGMCLLESQSGRLRIEASSLEYHWSGSITCADGDGATRVVVVDTVVFDSIMAWRPDGIVFAISGPLSDWEFPPICFDWRPCEPIDAPEPTAHGLRLRLSGDRLEIGRDPFVGTMLDDRGEEVRVVPFEWLLTPHLWGALEPWRPMAVLSVEALQFGHAQFKPSYFRRVAP